MSGSPPLKSAQMAPETQEQHSVSFEQTLIRAAEQPALNPEESGNEDNAFARFKVTIVPPADRFQPATLCSRLRMALAPGRSR